MNGLDTHFSRGERWGLSDDTYVLYAWWSKIVRGPQKEKLETWQNDVYLFYIYIFSFFCSQFLLCPNWSFSKRCIQNNGKDSGYLFIARSDSINVWTWVNMSFLFIYLFLKLRPLSSGSLLSMETKLPVQPLLPLWAKWPFDFQITYLLGRVCLKDGKLRWLWGLQWGNLYVGANQPAFLLSER